MEKNIKKIIKSKIKEIISVSIIIIIVFIYFVIQKGVELLENKKDDNINNFIVFDNQIEVNSVETTEIDKIKIHITGEVKVSGVYELEKGSRIEDAIKLAEGTTINADLSKVNLAYELEDGQKIKIPSINEDDVENYISENSGENIIDNEEKDSKININTATQMELTTLNGVGESTALKIIKYREENGKFKSIEDIKNVSGIGENKYNQIKDYIKAK